MPPSNSSKRRSYALIIRPKAAAAVTLGAYDARKRGRAPYFIVSVGACRAVALRRRGRQGGRWRPQGSYRTRPTRAWPEDVRQTRTKPNTNATRFRRTEQGVPRHQSCSEMREPDPARRHQTKPRCMACTRSGIRIPSAPPLAPLIYRTSGLNQVPAKPADPGMAPGSRARIARAVSERLVDPVSRHVDELIQVPAQRRVYLRHEDQAGRDRPALQIVGLLDQERAWRSADRACDGSGTDHPPAPAARSR